MVRQYTLFFYGDRGNDLHVSLNRAGHYPHIRKYKGISFASLNRLVKVLKINKARVSMTCHGWAAFVG